MYEINGNKLSIAGIRFELPNNFYLDVNGWETEAPDGLRFISPNNDYIIQVMTCDIEYQSGAESLGVLFEENALNIIKPIERYEKNNLTGYDVVYELGKKRYYEIHFDRLVGMDRQLEILVIDSNNGYESERIKTFINGIKVKEVERYG